jgi:hypothetical protein
MKAKRVLVVAALCAVFAGALFAQGADPKTVTPAWVIEKQIAEQAQVQTQAQAEAPKPKSFNLFFIGYDYPTFSGLLAPSLAGWTGPLNFSLGFESANSTGSSMLSGLELEFFVAAPAKGLRLQMNDMVMIGYSFALKPMRFNIGARLGLSLLDMTDDSSASNTYMGLGGIIGPEASLYAELAPDFWLWVRGRYSLAYFMSIDSNGSSPLDTGSTTLNTVSLEAGLGFRM